MEETDIKTISIEDFKTNKHLLDYCEHDVIVVKNENFSGKITEDIRLSDCFLIVYCFEGEAVLNINNKDYRLNKDCTAVLLPGSIIRKPSQKRQKDANIRIIGFSTDFMKKVAPRMKKETWNIVYQLHQNPILPSGPKESYKFYLYKELAYTLMNDQQHPFRDEILKHYFAAIFCEMMGEMSKVLPQENVSIPYQNNRSNWIFRKFAELVMKDDGTHRSVSYYADLLCYSPKHLSTVVKQVSGRSPLRIINEHAIDAIKYQLEHSDMSMKELTEYFKFANPSFFGKFVKQHTGMSPQQYRNQHTE